MRLVRMRAVNLHGIRLCQSCRRVLCVRPLPGGRTTDDEKNLPPLRRCLFSLAKRRVQASTYLLSLDSSRSGSTALTRHATGSLVSNGTSGSNNTRLSLETHVTGGCSSTTFCPCAARANPSTPSTLPCHHQHRGLR